MAHVRDLRIAGMETALPNHGTLLVSDAAGDGGSVQCTFASSVRQSKTHMTSHRFIPSSATELGKHFSSHLWAIILLDLRNCSTPSYERSP